MTDSRYSSSPGEGRRRLSRRSFLLGAGALATGACGIAGSDVVDHGRLERALHRVGLASSPDRHFPPSGATERSGTLDSRHMAGPVKWSLSLPAGNAPPTGIVFCLHGFHGDHRFAFDQVHIPDVAASLGLRLAVAGVDGGADSYWHRRADGTDALSMLVDEFVPMVRGLIGGRPQALMGWSMGGYGALLAAERAGSSFVGVAPASPALWTTPGATAAGAFDSPTDFYANDVFSDVHALSGMVVAVACGTSDPFYPATQRLVATMSFPHDTFFGPGFHETGYWRSVAPDQLRALAAVLS